MRIFRRAVLVLLPLVALVLGSAALIVRRDFNEAERLLARGDPANARSLLARYLQIYRRDDRARLLLAKAIVASDELPAEESARHAIAQLDRISDSSPLAAEARTRTGRLLFLILLRPREAERVFHRAIELDHDHLDAYLMLWNILNVTGRFDLTEPVFWRVYELTPDDERAVRLRDWYLTEFGPGSAFRALDRKLGILGNEQKPSIVTELDRLRQFRTTEPDWPVSYAAVARLVMREGHAKLAQEVLQQVPSMDEALADPFFRATQVEILMETGDVNRAAELIDRWPEPRVGYDYWKWQATIADEVHHDDVTALDAYDRAIRASVGGIDWQLMNRKAHCLIRAGRPEEAAQLRKSVSRIAEFMDQDYHQQLRRTLVDLDSPQAVREIIAFYRGLDRPREVVEWTKHLNRLSGTVPNPQELHPTLDGKSRRR